MPTRVRVTCDVEYVNEAIVARAHAGKGYIMFTVSDHYVIDPGLERLVRRLLDGLLVNVANGGSATTSANFRECL